VFTLKLRGPKEHTLPFILCVKMFNVSELFILLLEELMELRAVTPRFWIKEKQMFLNCIIICKQ
jgi:hypothetical protein